MVLDKTLNCPLYYLRTPNNPIMSKQVLISMLKQGETGAEILEILEAISTENDEIMPTLDEIAF